MSRTQSVRFAVLAYCMQRSERSAPRDRVARPETAEMSRAQPELLEQPPAQAPQPMRPLQPPQSTAQKADDLILAPPTPASSSSTSSSSTAAAVAAAAAAEAVAAAAVTVAEEETRPLSGYMKFAQERRPKLKAEKPDLSFGEVRRPQSDPLWLFPFATRSRM